MNLTGKSLGRYQILEPLGEGGMATVYKAYDTRLEREVAVKVIRREAFPPNQLERILARFEREAKSLARLNHPNIVKVHDFGDHDGAPYFVMEYLPGGTLKQRLGEPMPWQQAAKILLPVAEALEYAHEQKMVHRDVKPSNILLTGKGAPLLTDFGVAKLLDLEDGQTLTGTGVGIGTPEYMAPEQWTNKTVPQSDIYGLGVVFYEMVSGRKPYQADTPAALLLKQANDPLPRPSQFAPGLPEAVERVLLKALAKRVEDRYASMGELAAALEKLTQGAPAPAAPPARPRQEEPASRYDQPTRDEPPAPVYTHQSAPASRRIPAWGWGMGGLALLIIFALTLINLPKPVATSPIPSPTDTSSPTMTALPTATTTRTPTPAHTATIGPTSIPTLGIGSTLIREKEGMVMVYVPDGEFVMGDDNTQPNESPARLVILNAFWIDQTEITNTMYAVCVQDRDCSQPRNTDRYYNITYANHPVTFVSWRQANDYCLWANARLPTEAEWEKSARGYFTNLGNVRNYPWGNSDPNCSLANYGGCVGNTSPTGNHPAGVSIYGALDMAGNVWEWVADWYDPQYYNRAPDENPLGPNSGEYRVLRGGSWYNHYSLISSTFRNWSSPGDTSDRFGFRCARSAP